MKRTGFAIFLFLLIFYVASVQAATSTNKGYTLQGTGTNAGTWGITLNNNFNIIDKNVGGRVEVDVSGSSDVTATSSNAQYIYQYLHGTLTGNIEYILPDAGALYVIENATSGSYTLEISAVDEGTSVTVEQGTIATVFVDSSNNAVVAVQTDGANITNILGTNIQANTVGDGEINFTSVTGADLTLTDSGAITASGLITGNANLNVANGATSAGVIKILEDTDDGSNYTTITVPALSANIDYVLPPDDGNDGDVLFTSGDGTLGWAAPSGGELFDVQVFTSSDTWNRLSGTLYVVAECVGPGGGGGGSGSSNNAGGGGGGAGGYSWEFISSPGATETVTIGSVGSAGTSTGNGGNGGTTSFGSHITCNGGSGGSVGGTTNTGGGGGTASGGDINVTGGDGFPGGGSGSFASPSGSGGASFYGSGAAGVVAQGTGSAGNAIGSGGSGGKRNTVSQAGGAGAASHVVVKAYR